MNPASFTQESGVVRDFHRRHDETYRDDPLQLPPTGRVYLSDYDIIFLAAGRGDVEICQKVIDCGFRAFYATSTGSFLYDGTQLNGLSPRRIAELRGHSKIVELFDSYIFQPTARSSVPAASEKKPYEFLEDEQAVYDHYIDYLKFNLKDKIGNVILDLLEKSFTEYEMIVMETPLLNLITDEDALITFLRKRINLSFADEKRLSRPVLIALRDYIDNNRKIP